MLNITKTFSTAFAQSFCFVRWKVVVWYILVQTLHFFFGPLLSKNNLQGQLHVPKDSTRIRRRKRGGCVLCAVRIDLGVRSEARR